MAQDKARLHKHLKILSNNFSIGNGPETHGFKNGHTLSFKLWGKVVRKQMKAWDLLAVSTEVRLS